MLFRVGPKRTDGRGAVLVAETDPLKAIARARDMIECGVPEVHIRDEADAAYDPDEFEQRFLNGPANGGSLSCNGEGVPPPEL